MRQRSPITPTMIAALRAVRAGRVLQGAQWIAFRKARRLYLIGDDFNHVSPGSSSYSLTPTGELVLAAYDAGAQSARTTTRRQ